MERQAPVAPSDEIDLYVQTYSSLLRSTGDVRVRAFEEAHAFARSSLHEGALSPTPDLSAFAYSAARLPLSMPEIELVVLGQSHELFEAAGFEVRQWERVTTRGRRRPLRYNNKGTLGVFIASSSDIDDLVPILTAYQIEWNKMHARLNGIGVLDPALPLPSPKQLCELLAIPIEDYQKLIDALGVDVAEAGIRALIARPIDIRVRMLAASFSQYQRAAQRWWSGIEPSYLRPNAKVRRPAVYFVSSNTHAIANLVGGSARAQRNDILDYAERCNPEGLAEQARALRGATNELDVLPLIYYLYRGYLHEARDGSRIARARAIESESGLVHLSGPGHVDVDAQLIDISKLRKEAMDPRLHVPGIESLAESNALILNIDYPLGLAAYHLLSRLGQAVGELRGVYVMGKAATLNGRVGDVTLSGVVYDAHSRNTFLFANGFSAKDVRPYLQHGSVFDNQAALTVRSAFLQNRPYMGTFYRDGYSVLEMEAGPFLSAIYELCNATRSPEDEIVHLSNQTPFEIGFLHYASDTPYSRRQSLLSKSLSYFGVDSTYACAIAIVRRILEKEIASGSGSVNGTATAAAG